MSKHLVIVESPAKAKTIKKYLGKDYEVLASYGHVRDLVPRDGAVDVSNNFAMHYEALEKSGGHVRAIGQALKDADNLILATDPDREGEAIAWHLTELLKERKLLKDKTVQRVVFYEITEREVKNAIEHPRKISAELVNAQQARRALDHLYGFNLSPLLWRKISPGLSAGRVQSPALRLICEREDEIRKFVPQEYWTVEARAEKESQPFTARLVEYRGAKVEQFTLGDTGSAEAAKRDIVAAAGGQLRVASVEKKQRRRNPSPPFTTSTLQQEANRKLGYGAKRTMQTAQQLYQGVDIGGESVGLITYMRTDSVSLAQDAVADIRALVEKKFGRKALPAEPRVYKAKSKNAQEAHEAIRPTSASRTPEEVAKFLPAEQARLYELIWRRAIASQMEAAVFDTVAAELRAGTAHAFRANGQILVEPGFLAAYNIRADSPEDDDAEDDEKRLPLLAEGETVKLLDVVPEQHFTEPPPRYTEASLVKTLEEYDIGRPSTYATIISTLQARNYVQLNGKAFVPTDVGMIVNRFLTEHFTHYVDYGFTAHLEDELDEVSRGERDWVPVLKEFWDGFKPTVDLKMELKRQDVSETRALGTDPASGKPVTTRLGRFGPFVQIGTKEDPEKPRFASLRPNQRLDTITLEQALELFKLPRKVGATPEGEDVTVGVGRFGPFVKIGKTYCSLRKEDDPMTITLERALELMSLKKQAMDAATLKRFDGSIVRVIKGRFGPYIHDEGRRARIPKGKDYASLTLEECVALLDEQNVAKKGGRKRKAAPKAAAAGGGEAAKAVAATPKPSAAPKKKAPPAKKKKKAAPRKKPPESPAAS
ncbi:MAG TPA: DNA topoisomerase I [Candidatus Binatia bacterium]|nr:DNA topoisomerase I [Candidatus Binatia bacterium]